MYVRDAKQGRSLVARPHRVDGARRHGVPLARLRRRDRRVRRKAGFGRIRVHKFGPDSDDDEIHEVCELTSIGVLEGWREQGVRGPRRRAPRRVRERPGFETVYTLTGEGGYLAQFGFQRIDESRLPEPLQRRLEEKRDGVDPDAKPLAIDVVEFRMPDRLREAFKRAPEGREEASTDETPEDFGIDPDSATYKYDTGR